MTDSRPPRDCTALVVFTDMRGFTRWAESVENAPYLSEFVEQFLTIVRKHITNVDFIKGLGDGALLIREVAQRDLSENHAGYLRELLRQIASIEQEFAALRDRTTNASGRRSELRLGWGVARGTIKTVRGPEQELDYVGSTLNRCARLCEVARPYGIVIDRQNFPDNPSTSELPFYEQTRRLSGLSEEVEVWVTSEIDTQFVTREKLRQTPEVHVAGLCVDSAERAPRVLLAKRSPERAWFPGLWEGCGGQLARGETFVQGVRRHFKRELNIEVEVQEDVHCFYKIEKPNSPLVPGIRFLCKRLGAQEPRSNNHTEFQWATLKEMGSMGDDAFVPGLRQELQILLNKVPAKRSK